MTFSLIKAKSMGRHSAMTVRHEPSENRRTECVLHVWRPRCIVVKLGGSEPQSDPRASDATQGPHSPARPSGSGYRMAHWAPPVRGSVRLLPAAPALRL
jgi:hypothetical protein